MAPPSPGGPLRPVPRPVITDPGRRADEVTKISAEEAVALAPGIKPEIIRQMYAAGLTVETGLLPGNVGGEYYGMDDFRIRIRPPSIGNRTVPSLISPFGYSQTTFGTRGGLEHEFRHAAQEFFAPTLSQALNPMYMAGRLTMRARTRADLGRPLLAIPGLPGALTVPGAGEAFANYGEGAYPFPRLPLSTYAPFHSGARSTKSITAEVERLNAAANYYGINPYR